MKSWDERFVEEATSRIVEDIQDTYNNFGKGSWIKRDDAAATGMAAVLLQAKIDGLQIALLHLKQTHDAMTGKAEKRKDAA